MLLNNMKLLFAVAMIMTGLLMVIFGNTWGSLVFELLAGSEIGLWLEHIVPFLPMAVIGFGTVLFFSGKQG